MKITKTLFKTEVEVTPDELQQLLHGFKPYRGVWEWVCNLLGIIPVEITGQSDGGN